MKFLIRSLLLVSFTIGGAYLVFRSTPIGKQKLKSWMLTRWEKMSKKRSHPIDLIQYRKELDKLEYPDLELLYRMTLLDPIVKLDGLATGSRLEKRFHNLLDQMRTRNLPQRADLKPLENLILPS